MSANRTQFRGFTLIELLVVISIIALLIGILLPALGAARSAAKSAVCLSNLRQIGIAQAAYEGLYGVFPPSEMPETGPGANWRSVWDYRLLQTVDLGGQVANFNEYIEAVNGNGSPLLCPELEPKGDGSRTRSYAQNSFVDIEGNTSDDLSLQPARKAPGALAWMMQIDTFASGANLNDVLFVGDIGWNTGTENTNGFVLPSYRSATDWTDAAPNVADFRHSNAKNVLFLDLHASSVDESATMGQGLVLID